MQLRAPGMRQGVSKDINSLSCVEGPTGPGHGTLDIRRCRDIDQLTPAQRLLWEVPPRQLLNVYLQGCPV